ncbi:RNA methyltransferase [Candidatus Walczuchella monophlebidarum]|uniref:tRNA/rRNA methyltransferase family protein n=1 Tax=Candidatus Walczuchella monophlebidarum TaxID=1415657 RepID=A0A068DQJ4_9FLAO|nr:RNA methyltransferase [Candidatus Walczuchella monophlebidarum]AID37522.1 tRNA/rRNA methyltransferase family protein [Candidatus Walczuchella monophlebidarum]
MNIYSNKNLKIKNLLRLQKKYGLRIEQHLIIVEGLREIEKALQGNYKPKEIFICKDLTEKINVLQHFPRIIEISRKVFEKIAYRKKSGGLIGLFYRHAIKLENLNTSKALFLLILDGIEKPGNLGAILRSAEAIDLDGIILYKSKTDIFHPNVIRASLGTVFTQKIIEIAPSKLFFWIKKNKVQLIVSSLRNDATNLYHSDLRAKIAVVIGSESFGASKEIIKASDKILKIPMRGNIDSLNVSNAAAVILFEAFRQRLDGISSN